MSFGIGNSQIQTPSYSAGQGINNIESNEQAPSNSFDSQYSTDSFQSSSIEDMVSISSGGLSTESSGLPAPLASLGSGSSETSIISGPNNEGFAPGIFSEQPSISTNTSNEINKETGAPIFLVPLTIA